MKKIFLLVLSVAMALTIMPVMQTFAFTRPGGEPPKDGGQPPEGKPGDDHGGPGQDNSILATAWTAEPEKTQLDEGETAKFTLTITNKSSNSESVTLATKDTGLTISPTTLTLAAGAKADVTATVVMPAQSDRPEAMFTITMTSADVKNKTVMFRIRYKSATEGQKADQNLVTTWETAPEKTQLDAGQTASFKLNVTNKTTANQTITLSTKSAGLALSPTNLTIAASETVTVAVNVTMPAQNNKREAEFSIDFACSGVTGKSVRFRIMYKTQVKPPENSRDITFAWASDPSKATLAAGATATYILNLTNKSTASQRVTLSTKSTGLTITPTTATIAAGKSAAISVKVVMPAKGKTNMAEFVILLATAAGKKFDVRFFIKYPTAVATCAYSTAWVINPASVKLAAGAKATYAINITNKGAASTTFKLTAGKNMTLSSSSFTLAAGKTQKVNVTVTMPAKAAKATKADFSFTVANGCGKSSTIKFTINYK